MLFRESLHCETAKVPNYILKVSKFKCLSRYYIHFWTNTLEKRYEPSYLLSYGLNRIMDVLLQGWLWHLITHEGWYAIKQKKPKYRYIQCAQKLIDTSLNFFSCHFYKKTKWAICYFFSLFWTILNHHHYVKSVRWCGLLNAISENKLEKWVWFNVTHKWWVSSPKSNKNHIIQFVLNPERIKFLIVNQTLVRYPFLCEYVFHSK